MPLFPSQDALQHTFGTAAQFGRAQSVPRATPYQARPELYGAYSIVDDTKSKAQKLSAEANREIELASQKAQAKVGGIELYSGKYYAACTFGGLLACVSIPDCHVPLHPSNTTVRA
jgi:solute carrier family 25 phosphate transporter 3